MPAVGLGRMVGCPNGQDQDVVGIHMWGGPVQNIRGQEG